MIRHFKPRKIIEIGSGFSTYLAADALLKNKDQDGCECELVAIEPYPDDTLEAGFPGLHELIRKKVQDVPISKFEELKENDILFIDSSHILEIGSDVQYELLEILPRLKEGVIIHFHDMFFPGNYPRDWVVKHLRFWNEQYALQAFLAFNDRFETLWAGSYMQLKHPEKLKAAFNSFDRSETLVKSYWIRRISD